MPEPVPAGKAYAAAGGPGGDIHRHGRSDRRWCPTRIVKVSVPSLTTPAGLVTVAASGTVEPATLKVAEALAAAVARGRGADDQAHDWYR